jgi:hypothetical protein
MQEKGNGGDRKCKDDGVSVRGRGVVFVDEEDKEREEEEELMCGISELLP